MTLARVDVAEGRHAGVVANGTRGKLVGAVYPAGAPVGSFPEALVVEVLKKPTTANCGRLQAAIEEALRFMPQKYGDRIPANEE